MSFSAKTKNEISRLEIVDSCCAIAELAALVRMSGAIQMNGLGKISLKFSTENAAIARRIFSLLKFLYNTHTEVLVRKNKQLKKNNSYLMVVDHTKNPEKILSDTGVFNLEDQYLYNINYKVPESIIENRCCKRAYIRGAFLGGGSISDPEKTYHLEFVTHGEEHGLDLSNIINSFGLNSKIVLRKESHIVYLKEGAQIVDILNVIGAHASLLQLENIRVLKEVRNNINRVVNCETANLGKTINASLRQIQNIRYINKEVGLRHLPPNLRAIAELRLEHQEASLKELGLMLDPPVGKSGVNHRLRKLEDMADEIKRERGEF